MSNINKNGIERRNRNALKMVYNGIRHLCCMHLLVADID